jgi:hypothetical protein
MLNILEPALTKEGCQEITLPFCVDEKFFEKVPRETGFGGAIEGSLTHQSIHEQSPQQLCAR